MRYPRSVQCARNLIVRLLFLTLLCPDGFAIAQADRRIDVHPKISKSGVAAGVVIAFGHVIPGPYKFEYLDSKLLVNGVQLIPSPLSEKENEKTRALVTTNRKRHLDELNRVQAVAQNKFERGRPPEEILQYVKSQSAVVADAKWESDRVMTFRLAGDKFFTHMFEFQGLSQQTRKQAMSAAGGIESQQRLLHQYEQDLENGMCLFFSSDNGVLRIVDPRRNIVQIMTKKNANDEDRLMALSKILSASTVAAHDVLANFSLQEWASKK